MVTRAAGKSSLKTQMGASGLRQRTPTDREFSVRKKDRHGRSGRQVRRETLKLAVPERERDWWRRLWGKILSPIPNCNAVENHPAFTCQSA